MADDDPEFNAKYISTFSYLNVNKDHMCFDIENLNFKMITIAYLEEKFKRISFLIKLQIVHLMINMYI